ncbi:MAG TPA: hypothetical protein VF550_13215 [Polyangia bacterium]
MMRALCLLCFLPACTRTTEMLGPAPTTHSYCPTTIDVYGGSNVSLLGCGGPHLAPDPLQDGYFAPGTPDYDATLAGRIYARLVYDPDLIPRFGSSWKVRSCSAPLASLSQLTPPLPEDDCGPNSPSGAGALLDICANDPAPLLLLSAGMLDDRCHGGGPDSSEADDPTTYARHLASRLDSFLPARHPNTALVGPTTEWTATPVHDVSFAAGCTWTRPDWDIAGLRQWKPSRTDSLSVSLVADLHGAFQRHNHCCGLLDLACDTNFSSGLGVVNCDGAQAIVDLWYQNLKALLLAQNYGCPVAQGH